jgi:hypothetical protein
MPSPGHRVAENHRRRRGGAHVEGSRIREESGGFRHRGEPMGMSYGVLYITKQPPATPWLIFGIYSVYLGVFIHLHAHSWFSFGQGASSPEAMIAAALSRGFTTLACTDTNGVYGAVEFQRAAEEAGVRPILGRTWSWVTRNASRWPWTKRAGARFVGRLPRFTGATDDGQTVRPARPRPYRRPAALRERSLSRAPRLRSGPGDVYAELRPGRSVTRCWPAARRLGVLPVVTKRRHVRQRRRLGPAPAALCDWAQ